MKYKNKLTFVIVIFALIATSAFVSIDSDSSDAASREINLGNIMKNGSSEFHFTLGDTVRIKEYEYSDSGVSESRYLVNYPGWLTRVKEGASYYYNGTVPYGEIQLTVEEERQVMWNINHTQFTFKIYTTATVSLNANGGTCPTTTLSTEGGSITLPAAEKQGAVFDGWYTSAVGGTKVGSAGSSYTPPGSITIYAQYVQNVVQFMIAGYSTSATSYTVPYNGYISLTFQTNPGSATVSMQSNPLGIPFDIQKSGANTTVSGSVTNVLPGTYYITIAAKENNYSDGILTVQVNVATAIIEPLTDTIYVNQTWYYQITTIPTSAKIQQPQSTVKDSAGNTVSNLKYTLYMQDRSFSIQFFETGTYYINLVVSAAGYSPATKQIILHVRANETISGSPFATGINATPNETVDGGYYFVVNGAINYHYLQWNFGDSSPFASETSVTHKFNSNGSFQVTCTLFNTTTGEQYVVFVTIGITLGLQIGTDAWVNVPYSYAVEGPNTGNVTMTTDIDQSWLSIRTFDREGKRYIELYSETGPFPSEVDKDLTVNVFVEGSPLFVITIHIWPSVDESSVYGTINLTAEGYVVTLTNTGATTASYIHVEWGDGKQGRLPDMYSGTHTYTTTGTYSVKASYIGNGGEIAAAFGMISVPSSGASYTIIYNSNGGTGTMSNSSGQNISVQNNTFTKEGSSFRFWNTSPNGTGTTFAPGSLINGLTADLTLYAIWTSSGSSGDGDGSKSGIPLWFVILCIIAGLICLMGLLYNPPAGIVITIVSVIILLLVWYFKVKS